MASAAAQRAAQAVLSSLMGQSPDEVIQDVLGAHSNLTTAEGILAAAENAGVALGGHIELELRLLTLLVEATGRPADELLRDAVA